MAQNLVPNSGFEEFTKCPNGHAYYGEKMLTPGWYSPNTGTPDYFNTCSKKNSHPFNNWAGLCQDFSGNGFVGIISFIYGKNYREYLATELKQPLDSGVTYSLQFSFRLSSYSKYSSGKLGMALTRDKIQVGNDRIINLTQAMIAMPDSGIVQQTGLWQTVHADYTAVGGERYVCIGNFSAQTPYYKIKFGGNNEPMLATASYYYIDDVVVQPQLKFEPDIPVALIPDNPFEQDSVIVLKNVQFAYNSDQLNTISENELNRLVSYLHKNSTAKIEIHGHTDDQGSASYNMQLSLRRAQSVLEYVTNHGIDKSRLSAHGFGKSSPLIDSTDELARGINRRVEVKLVK